ncbi:hypothetical protein ACIQXF_17460 [Lysinibacillus sp. NPDC097231]|uniref:hypothetical protein n=1 Tax=Lysinibacillus sp. NPDC097231 TaxID=3364142 RepID=UPI00382B1B90
MTHQVTATSNIDFSAKGVDEILQNVALILSTFVISYPLYREFGFRPDSLTPFQLVKRRNTARLIDSIQRFVPRAVVVDVDYLGDTYVGKLEPVVKVIINK